MHPFNLNISIKPDYILLDKNLECYIESRTNRDSTPPQEDSRYTLHNISIMFRSDITSYPYINIWTLGFLRELLRLWSMVVYLFWLHTTVLFNSYR